jgi:hypothetical protein
MGSSISQPKSFETTILACTNNNDSLTLKCSPPASYTFDINNVFYSYELHLNKDHPNYINLHNLINLGQSLNKLRINPQF